MYMSPSNYVEFYNKISYYEGKYYNDIRTLVEYYSNMLGLHEQKDWSLKLSIKFELKLRQQAHFHTIDTQP